MPLFRAQAVPFMSDTDQGAQQKIRRLAIEPGDRNQPAEISQMMDPQTLFFAVLAHDSHHVTTGLSTPRTFAAGTGPK